ncbi:DedA family protein [Alteromonas sp. KS69]|uniref:Membrane protein n=1 Tax=Alteromonas naphthalenivorans TaxID=715451 RepID=F5Z544_ALTNA|nr:MULTISPECIES: YqaA family protein [Alteromonas]MBB66022.1 DedA family protein [Rickettsiales bacterium]MBO7922035.1 DedA family protein [Alteromonas sp. K632G]PHS55705.1 MAG: DedA family protein [Alteromonas sp.]AEF04611.1 membrane protein [Alteromonas naphthalenivorans]RUP78741.1 DedA family protein [Alteromonas sp. KS69]
MKLFEPMYDMALRWARHRHAVKYLGGLSFAESVFFPIPPDVMLAPMSLSQPDKAWRFALITTLASIFGGIAGYWLGYFAFDAWLAPIIESWGYTHKIETATQWFADYGVWVVFVAGFSPIPYKVFTTSAGFLQMAFFPFLIASAVGRGARFFLVAGLMRWGGAPMEAKLRQYVEVLGWAVVLLAVAAYLILR